MVRWVGTFFGNTARMSNPLTSKTILLVRALVQPRTRRGSWAYILCLLTWLPPMIFAAGNLSFHVRPDRLLPLLIPIVVFLVQLAYPTLLGWVVVLIPSVFFAGVMACSVVLTAPGRFQQHELPALAISSVAAGVYVLVCGAIWFARPKPALAVVAVPNISPNAGPGGAPPASVT
jgi:hypothetical protein